MYSEGINYSPPAEGEPFLVFDQHRRINRGFVDTLKIAYPQLKCDFTEDMLTVDIGELTTDQIANILADLEFFKLNPSLPLENLFSRLETFDPKNDSQAELLEISKRLISLTDPRASAGIVMEGKPGVGKTHVSVGIAKELLKRGESPRYVNCESDHPLRKLDVENDTSSLWILDDLNSPYGMHADMFKMVVNKIHNEGGRLFVTTNADFEEMLPKMFGAVADGKIEAMRLIDRMKEMLVMCKIAGVSQRQGHSWLKDAPLELPFPEDH